MLFSTKLAKIIFIVTALVLLVISIILYVQINDLEEAYESINHTDKIKLHLEEAISHTKDAESAQRGFLITKDSLFLQPYWQAFEKANQSISNLRDLVKTDSRQYENLNKLEFLIKVRFDSIDQTTTKLRLQETPAVRRKVLLKEKAMMDSIRIQINKMNGIEVRRLGEREAVRNNHAFKAPLFGFLLIFLSLAVLTASYYRITLDLQRSKAFLEQTRALNAALLEKNRQLELSNEELDSFNYISSHDLQEPVRKIRTFVSMIEATDYDKLSEKNKYNFQRLQTAAKRIQDLLHDLISYSQIGKGKENIMPVDLNKILEETKAKFENETKETKAEITSDVLPTIPSIPFQMKQLFDNLISNAIKFRHPERAPQIHVKSTSIAKDELPKTVGIKQHEQYCKISFTDNGLGFDQVYADKIYEPFGRLHSSQEYPGTGIGLTICKKIVNNHKGVIDVKSKANEGTTFNIYLPSADPPPINHL